MARRRDYQAEYRARVARNKGLPRSVARGHGEIPADVARKLERGEISKGERRRFAKGIRAYEAHWGPAGRGRAGRERRMARTFASRQDAEDWANDLGVSGASFRVEERGAGFVVVILR